MSNPFERRYLAFEDIPIATAAEGVVKKKLGETMTALEALSKQPGVDFGRCLASADMILQIRIATHTAATHPPIRAVLE